MTLSPPFDLPPRDVSAATRRAGSDEAGVPRQQANPARHDATVRVARLIREATHQRPVDPDEVHACVRLVLDNGVVSPEVHFGALFAALQTGFHAGCYGEEHLWALTRATLEMDGYRLDAGDRWDAASPFVGCSGSGKKLVKTVNISTAASFLAAAAGARVLKISSRGAGNPIGSLDVLGHLGIATDPTSAVEAARTRGLGFIDVGQLAPRFNARYGGRFFFAHPLSYLSSALLYPVPLRALLLGIPHPQTELSAAALRRAGIHKGLVVCGTRAGEFNMDELSAFGPTRISVIEGCKIDSFTFHPESVGCRHAHAEELAVPSEPEAACVALERILAGTAPASQIDMAALNGGALLWLAGEVSGLEEGFARCRAVAAAGAARRLFGGLGGDVRYGHVTPNTARRRARMRADNVRMPCLLIRDARFELGELPLPEPERADWALVDVLCCGVCGSDIHLIRGEEQLGRRSAVLGHEIVGVVREAPAGGGALAKGAKVASIPFFTCETCRECMAGLPGNCRHKRGLGLDLTGGFAPVVSLPGKCLVPVPAGAAPDELYTLADGLAVVVNAMARLDRLPVPWRQGPLMIIGDGPIGLLTLWLARHHGAPGITLVAKNPAGRRLGMALGAEVCVTPEEASALRGRFPVVVEAVGGRRPQPYDLAFDAVTPGGVVMLLGVPGARFEEQCNLRLLTYKELCLTSTNSYSRRHFLEAVDLIARRHAEIGALVTHRLALAEAASGTLEEWLLRRHTSGAVKVVITPGVTT